MATALIREYVDTNPFAQARRPTQLVLCFRMVVEASVRLKIFERTRMWQEGRLEDPPPLTLGLGIPGGGAEAYIYRLRGLMRLSL